MVLSPPRPPIQPRSSTKYSVPVHRLKDRPSVNSSIRRKKQKQKQQLQQAHQCQQQAIGARSHMDKIDEMIVLQQNHSAGSSRMSPPAPAATVGTATNKPIVAAGDPAMRAGAATDPLAAAAAIHGHGMALSIPSNIGTSVPPAPSSAAAAASAAAHQAHLFQTERVPGAAPSPASLTPAAAASLYGSSQGGSVAYLQRLAALHQYQHHHQQAAAAASLLLSHSAPTPIGTTSSTASTTASPTAATGLPLTSVDLSQSDPLRAALLHHHQQQQQHLVQQQKHSRQAMLSGQLNSEYIQHEATRLDRMPPAGTAGPLPGSTIHSGPVGASPAMTTFGFSSDTIPSFARAPPSAATAGAAAVQNLIQQQHRRQGPANHFRSSPFGAGMLASSPKLRDTATPVVATSHQQAQAGLGSTHTAVASTGTGQGATGRGGHVLDSSDSPRRGHLSFPHRSPPPASSSPSSQQHHHHYHRQQQPQRMHQQEPPGTVVSTPDESVAGLTFSTTTGQQEVRGGPSTEASDPGMFEDADEDLDDGIITMTQHYRSSSR